MAVMERTMGAMGQATAVMERTMAAVGQATGTMGTATGAGETATGAIELVAMMVRLMLAEMVAMEPTDRVNRPTRATEGHFARLLGCLGKLSVHNMW